MGNDAPVTRAEYNALVSRTENVESLVATFVGRAIADEIMTLLRGPEPQKAVALLKSWLRTGKRSDEASI
jgi:hypothetical protein